ncbi:MAG TPA: TlpA disulfide reductase family protein [Rhodospirillales bacterium]|jgi:thiol-disulfide isomerase/thioredoxin|nr:hypothetical protein [Rhodospirillaceae bacterium]HJN23113.1 TlpA disulfide reductase family protein [Rhodospirillales bacterium]
MVNMLRFAFVAVVFLVITWVIVAIYPWLASVENEKCIPEADTFANFLPTRPPKPVPGEAFFDAAGMEFTLADYRGRGVVLNFWATWCAPCVREMPALDRLRVKLSGGGAEVLTISEDHGGGAVINKFFQVNNIRNLPALIDKRGVMLRSFVIKGLPTTVLIDAEGKEIGRVVGPAEWDGPKVAAFARGCLAAAGTP